MISVGGSAESCLRASRCRRGHAVRARVESEEQCGLVATSHAFIPGQRQGIKWKLGSLFVVIPSVRSHMSEPVARAFLHRSPTEFLSPFANSALDPLNLRHFFTRPEPLWGTSQPHIHTRSHLDLFYMIWQPRKSFLLYLLVIYLLIAWTIQTTV